MKSTMATVVALGLLAAACSSQAPRQDTVATRGGNDVAPQANLLRERAHPVAVELFTSQGCSSCPPADALIAELARNPDLVVITRPVTYWDRLGWRDTLGREENTVLQSRYAATLARGGGRSYTPQIVIDGRVGMVGSRRDEVRSAIDDASDRTMRVEVGVSGGRIELDRTVTEPALVQLVDLDPEATVAIGRGENRGRSITYTNIVTAEQLLGEWGGGGARFAIPPASPGVRRAVIVRQGEAGPILAARYL